MTARIKVTIDGQAYTSLTAAAKAHDLTIAQLQYRLEKLRSRNVSRAALDSVLVANCGRKKGDAPTFRPKASPLDWKHVYRLMKEASSPTL